MPEALSLSAAVKLWHTYNGEYEPDPECAHWGVVWEYLDLPAIPTARVSCYLANTVSAYDPAGNQLFGTTTHYNFMGAHPHLLQIAGRWREVISGRVEFHNGRWCMRWTVATNGHWPRLLNGEPGNA